MHLKDKGLEIKVNKPYNKKTDKLNHFSKNKNNFYNPMST